MFTNGMIKVTRAWICAQGLELALNPFASNVPYMVHWFNHSFRRSVLSYWKNFGIDRIHIFLAF